ncbi:MAG: hypothetical protein ACJ779_07060 [Chloroflexota bacterium]
MTTNLLHSTKDGSSRMDLAIGDADAHVFTCPACARPLSDGTSRCPGCGTRLIMGVRLKRAGAILALGAVIGVLVGGLTTAAAITLSLHDPARVAPATVPVAPVAAVVPSALPAFVVAPDLGAPVASVSALSGTAVVNGRITADATTLAQALRRSNATAIELARALRSLAADAALGVDLAGRLQPWTEAADVRVGLDDFYRTMADTARQGLRSSLTDDAAYRRAASAMLAVLRKLGDIDARSRALAGTVDLELAPVSLTAN